MAPFQIRHERRSKGVSFEQAAVTNYDPVWPEIFISISLSARCRSVPAAYHVPVPVSSHGAEVLRPAHALPRALHLLRQPIQCRHRGSERDGCSCLHPLHNLPAPAVPWKPEPELALPAQLVPLPPVLRHRFGLLPVLHGSCRRHRREHCRGAFAHPHADFLHGRGRSHGVRRRSRGPDRWQRRCGGWRQPQQLAKRHEHARTNGRVRLEALLRTEREQRQKSCMFQSSFSQALHFEASWFFSETVSLSCLNVVQCISRGFACFKTEPSGERTARGEESSSEKKK